MFDVGFSELVVIAVVALIVIGPERLPRVARTVGVLLGRLQRYVNDVKADINREIHLDEIKRLQNDVTQQVRGFESSVREELHQVERAISPPEVNPPAAAPETSAAAAPAATAAVPGDHAVLADTTEPVAPVATPVPHSTAPNA